MITLHPSIILWRYVCVTIPYGHNLSKDDQKSKELWPSSCLILQPIVSGSLNTLAILIAHTDSQFHRP